MENFIDSIRINAVDFSKKWECLQGKFIVYFLELDDDVIYIGRSVNIYNRLVAHKMDKYFNRIYIEQYETYDLMCKAERCLIKEYNPPLNRKGKSKIDVFI